MFEEQTNAEYEGTAVVSTDGLISEEAFVDQLTKIFVSDIDTRMRITFYM